MDNDLISRQAAIDIASGYCHPSNIAEELAKLPPAQPDVPDTNVGDMISRQAAIDALTDYIRRVCLAFLGCMTEDEGRKCATSVLQSVHTAHRPVDERKHGEWIDLRQEGDNRFMCSVCKWKEHVPTCMGKPTVWEYCPSCGARMDGEENV